MINKLNGDPYLVAAINDWAQGKGEVSTVFPNGMGGTYRYLTDKLELTAGALLDRNQFYQVMTHEIGGHYRTRDFVLDLLNENSSQYQGKTDSQVKQMVVDGCYYSEAVAHILEFRK